MPSPEYRSFDFRQEEPRDEWSAEDEEDRRSALSEELEDAISALERAVEDPDVPSESISVLRETLEEVRGMVEGIDDLDLRETLERWNELKKDAESAGVPLDRTFFIQ
jgi:septation ring formation regulator EzrA